MQYSKFCQNISQTSLLCSYVIYLSRNDPWTRAEYLVPVKHYSLYYLFVKTNSSA